MSDVINDNVTVSRDAILAYEKRIQDLIKERDAIVEANKNKIDMCLQIQNVIDGPPMPPENLYKTACQSDEITFTSWEETWRKHAAENGKEFDIVGGSCLSENGKHKLSPAIIAGSGPSLKKNVKHLSSRGGIPLVSCLHNYGFFEDNQVFPEYYVNLDAGDITIDEMSQGGTRDAQYYWDSTKDKTLLTAIIANPTIHRKWKGKILWFCPPPAKPEVYENWKQSISPNADHDPVVFNIGGNTLGACMYFAKAVLGCNPICFVGADFCFSYMKKFHPFDSPYDQKFSGLMSTIDIWGNKVYTWMSYFGFKNFFEFIACGGKNGVPGIWVNCTEGGILGSYLEGNIKQIIQMPLEQFVYSYKMWEELPKLRDAHKGIPALTF